MRTLRKKMTDIWCLLCCAYILGWRSVVVIFSSLRRNMDHRSFVNRFTKKGATDILNIVKANYSIEYPPNSAAFEKEDSYIFMSNHQSLFDIPLIYATLSGTIRFVTKAELFRIPLFGRALHVGECIPVHRNNPLKKDEFIRIAKEKLAKGVSLWIFPEGTRSRTKELLLFKTGGFNLALQTLTKIVPVAIVNTRSIMPPKKFDLSYNQTVCVRVGEPIDVSGYLGQESLETLIKRVRSVIEQLSKN